MTEPYKVILIVDPAYGKGMIKLPPHVPVWIIESDLNTPVVDRLQQERVEETHLQGITTFKGKPKLSSEQQVIWILEQVDLHHGEFSSDPPYSILEVIGCTANDDVKQELQDYGFAISKITKDGFTAARREQRHKKEDAPDQEPVISRPVGAGIGNETNKGEHGGDALSFLSSLGARGK